VWLRQQIGPNTVSFAAAAVRVFAAGDGRAFVKEFGKMAEALEGAKGKLALVLSKPAGEIQT
jgi:hypothetical protein